MTNEQWMAELYNIALDDIGEDTMEHSSWVECGALPPLAYYTNKEVWGYYIDKGYSPIEAYASDVENCK